MIWPILLSTNSSKALDFMQGLVIAQTNCSNTTGLSVSSANVSVAICTKESLIYTQATLVGHVAFILSRSAKRHFVHAVNLHTSYTSLIHQGNGVSNDLSIAFSDQMYILKNSELHQVSSTPLQVEKVRQASVNTTALQVDGAVTMKSFNNVM